MEQIINLRPRGQGTNKRRRGQLLRV